jgi:hypothetical protein
MCWEVYCYLLFFFFLVMLKMDSLGLFWVSMGLITIVREGIYGRNWLACLVSGTCHGALGVISTLFVFLVKD